MISIDTTTRTKILRMMLRRTKRGGKKLYTVKDIMAKVPITRYSEGTIHCWLGDNCDRGSLYNIRRFYYGSRVFFMREGKIDG